MRGEKLPPELNNKFETLIDNFRSTHTISIYFNDLFTQIALISVKPLTNTYLR